MLQGIIEIWGIYYIGPRVPTASGTMLQLLNSARGSDNLREDAGLMGACSSLAVENVAAGISQHNVDTGQFNEVIAVAPDSYSLSSVVQGWMASPLHATAIRGGVFGVEGTTKFGWAEGTYSANMTQITIAAGMYNNGDYTTTPTTIDIPLEFRGHMKFYVVQVAI